MSKLSTPDQEKPRGDPLESLHKMSRTAGLGSQEYVAINTTAVVALIMGLVSASVVLSTILLALPVATIVIAIVAIQQIRHSAGTQTGKGLAALGMVIALAFVLVVGGREYLHKQAVKREQAAISALIEQLGKDFAADEYDRAWALFDSRFKERVSKDVFVSYMTARQGNAAYGRVRAIYSNGIVDVQIEPDSGTVTGTGVILIQLPNNGEDRREATFRKTPDGEWQFDDISTYFPDAQKQQQQQ